MADGERRKVKKVLVEFEDGGRIQLSLGVDFISGFHRTGMTGNKTEKRKDRVLWQTHEIRLRGKDEAYVEAPMG